MNNKNFSRMENNFNSNRLNYVDKLKSLFMTLAIIGSIIAIIFIGLFDVAFAMTNDLQNSELLINAVSM